MLTNVCLMFHNFIYLLVFFLNILDTRITLDSSLEMNVTIKVNIKKRSSCGSWE